MRFEVKSGGKQILLTILMIEQREFNAATANLKAGTNSIRVRS